MNKFSIGVISALFYLSIGFAHAGKWITDEKTGCQVWDVSSFQDETISWSGACSKDKKANGKGALQRYSKGGKAFDQFAGEMLQGRILRGRRIGISGNIDIEMREGKEYGNGFQILANGKFEGEFIDDLWHKGTLILEKIDEEIISERVKSGLRALMADFHLVGRYEGEFDGFLKNGQGVFTWPDGRRYEGPWFKGVHLGKNISKYAIDGMFYDCEVEYPDEKWRGKGVCTNEGNRYEGDFFGKSATGKGILVKTNGERYEGDFVNGKRTGKGINTWANGDRYDGDFVDGARAGNGNYSWINGERYEGGFVDGKRSGKGISSWSNGDRYEGDFVDNKRTGKTVMELAKINGVYIDKSTGLMWRRCAIGRNWDQNKSGCTGDGVKASWGEMVGLVSRENYAGFSDWRLPTVIEYQTVISAKSIKSCDTQKSVVKKLFPNVFSPNMFGSNHWLADNSGDLTTPSSADLEVVTGMLGCRVTENALRAHALQPAIMVRGGSVPQEWTFALSKLNIVQEINAKSEAESSKYWNGVGQSIRNVMAAGAQSTQSPSSFCSVSDTCFEVISTVKDKIIIKCTKGHMIGTEKVVFGPNANGKYAAGMLSGYHRGFRETGNFQCGE